MTDLIISKKCFINREANQKTKERVMAHIIKGEKKSPALRYRHRYKTAVIPVMSTVFLLGGYIVYQNISAPIRVQNDITQTQTTINELVTMMDNQTF